MRGGLKVRCAIYGIDKAGNHDPKPSRSDIANSSKVL